MPKKIKFDTYPFTIYIVPSNEHIYKTLESVKDVVPEGTHLVPDSESDNARNFVVSNSRRHKMCKGTHSDYDNQSLFMCSYFVFLQTTQDPFDLLGFVTVMIEKEKQMYIDLICSNPKYSGTGTFLLNFLKKIARHTEKTSIHANSTNDAILFYKKKGFRIGKRDEKLGLSHVRLGVTKRKRPVKNYTRKQQKHQKKII
jgi:hypothetical protein